MIETKREIILEEGIPVSIYDKDMELIDDTISLVGKATRQFFSEISLESHRQGQFFPELNIRNGMIIRNNITNEDYIVVANYPEVINQEVSTTITRMIVCNSSITIKRLVEEADRFGNITREFKSVYENISVYAEPIKSEIKQVEPGKFPQTIYKIHAPDIEMEIEDQIIIDVNGVDKDFKMAGEPDYLTFKGIMIVDITTETRL